MIQSDLHLDLVKWAETTNSSLHSQSRTDVRCHSIHVKGHSSLVYCVFLCFFGGCWHTVPFNLWVAFCFLFSGSVGEWVKCVYNFLHMYTYTDTFIYLLLYIYVIFEHVHTCSEYRIGGFNYHTQRIIKMHSTHDINYSKRSLLTAMTMRSNAVQNNSGQTP